MKKSTVKKLLPYLPYLILALLGTKLGEAARLAPGTNFSSKALRILDGMRLAFRSPLPSFHLVDLLFGAAVGGLIRLAVYVEG